MSNKTSDLGSIIQESVREALMENVNIRKVILENRLTLLNEMIELDEAEWLQKAKDWFHRGRTGAKNAYLGASDAASKAYQDNVLVNPEKIISDSGQSVGLVSKAIAKSMADVTAFKADALRSSGNISKLQDSVFDMFGKFFNLLDSIPGEQKGKLEREVMQVMGMFYNALMEEKKRVEVYLSALAREAGSQGYNLGQSSTAMAGYRPEKTAQVVGGRVEEPEEEPETGLVGARV